MRAHRFFDHTGDFGADLEASSEAELYEASVDALLTLMVDDLTSVSEAEERAIEARGVDPEDQLVALGNEILYLFETGWLARRVEVDELDDEVLTRADELAANAGGALHKAANMQEAAEGAQVVYARSWQSLESYGNPTLSASQRSRHTDWMVDEKLFAKTDDARLMHAMPVRRNVEVTDEVLDGPRSLLYAQAANRLHSQKALLLRLLG